MNPWKIIGWIVLGFMLLLMYSCYSALAPEGSPGAMKVSRSAPPPYSVYATKIECDGRGRDKAQITIDNNGAEIPYAKAFVEFLNQDGSVASANDSYFSPSTVPQKARASTTVYSSGTGSTSCQLVSIQDGDGNPVKIL